MPLIIPKTYIQVDAPLIFLLGPIRSAPLWQDDAAQIILSENPDLFVISPRGGIRDKIRPYVILKDESHFQRQREWEWHYQVKSARKGALMFWLPQEAEHHCDKSYGLMTSNEFGHWTALYQGDKSINLCVGSDGLFPELRTFVYDLQRKAPDKIIFSTLEKTCAEAVRLARK